MNPKISRFAEAILEMAGDQHSIGLMDNATYEKITLRHLGPKALSAAQLSRVKKFARCAKRRT